MELVNRYLQAVQNWLPAAQDKTQQVQQQDILAELSEAILSRMDERKAEIGRELSNAEQADILKTVGHPMLVAARYQGQQYLIGPALYPFWKQGLRMMLGIIASVHIALTSVALVQGARAMQSIVQGAFDFAGSALFGIGVMTALFHFFEHQQIAPRWLENWQPLKLAPVDEELKISRTSSMLEIAVYLVFILWWVGWLKFPALAIDSMRAISLSDIWISYWWPILMLGLIELGLALSNLLQPQWTRARLMLRIANITITIAIACRLLLADTLLYAAQDTVSRFPEQATVDHTIQLLLSLLIGSSVIAIVNALRNLWRLR